MSSRYAHVVLIWPVALPGSGELRAEIDAAAEKVDIVREEDGALVISRGDAVLRIERPEIESATFVEGGHFVRSHLNLDGVPLEREPGAVVASSGWKAFPPRLPEQPVFYPVTNVEYAKEIAERWNAAEGRGAHILRFRLAEAAVARWLPVRCVGARHHTELWVPAQELDALNEALIGLIEPVP